MWYNGWWNQLARNVYQGEGLPLHRCVLSRAHFIHIIMPDLSSVYTLYRMETTIFVAMVLYSWDCVRAQMPATLHRVSLCKIRSFCMGSNLKWPYE